MLHRFIARISVAALVVSGAAVLAGAVPANAAAVSAALIRALPQPACPAGTTPLTPASASVTSHGADVYHYAMPSGRGFDAYVPPAGFQPLQADNATLAEMNLPTRPANGTDLASWTTKMAGYKGTSTPALCQDSQPVSTPAKVSSPTGAPSAAHGTSLNWSGYVDSQGGYTKVVGHWTQTSAHTCNCTGPTDEVTWVGLGGYDTGRLIQDGTRNYSNTQPYGWLEYLSSATDDTGIVEVAPTTVGDDIAATVAYSTANGGTATFGLTDNGRYIFNIQETGLAHYYDGSTAEFINERPLWNNSTYHTLTNYVRTDWRDARVFRGSQQIAVADSDPIGVEMTNGGFYTPSCSSSTSLLAYAENISGGTFDNIWCRAS